MDKDFSIVITNYNGEQELPLTLESVKELRTTPREIILVDDGSTDLSIEVALKTIPSIRIVSMGRNTAHLNMVRNAGLKAATTGYVFLMDNDISLESETIDVLMEEIQRLRNAAVCTPRVLCTDDRNRVYDDGSHFHFIGQIVLRTQKNAPADPSAGLLENTASGGIVLLALPKARQLDFFNELYCMGWGDDGELYHRLTLWGYKCYQIPHSICYHLPKERTTERAYAQVFNRWLLILETYSGRTLIFLAPAFLVYEILLFLFLVTKGVPGEYFRAMGNLVRHLPDIWPKRKVVQSHRKVSDRSILTNGDFFVSDSLLDKVVLKAALKFTNRMFSSYWVIAKRFLPCAALCLL